MDTVLLWLIVTVIFKKISTSVINAQEIVQEICQTESLQAACPESHIIMVKRAAYGRMRLGNCVTIDMGHLGCQKDVTAILDRACSGDERCEVFVPNADLEATEPCLASLKNYLNVSYTCQQVFTPLVSNCDHLPHYDVTEESGYLASSVTIATGCGSPLSPWQLHAKPGQTINITLLDFSVRRKGHNAGVYTDGSSAKACRDYGLIEDDQHVNPTMICGGHARDYHVIHTSAHKVNISLAADETKPPFAIYFEVLGCPDEIATEVVWYKRSSSDTASMGCNHGGITWHMKCEGHKWVGKRGNCSFAKQENHKEGNEESDDIPYGLAIAIIIGAALVVCSLIVVIGVIRYSRRYNYDYNATYNTQTRLIRRQPPEEYELRCTCPVPPQHSKVPLPSTVDAAREQQHTMTIRRSPHVPRHYSLKKTVEVEGNDYEHIWQTPLPTPRTRHDPVDITASAQNNNNNVGDNMTTRNTNDSIASTNSSTTSSFKAEPANKDNKKPYYVTSKDILISGPKESYGTVNASEQQPAHLKGGVDSNVATDV